MEELDKIREKNFDIERLNIVKDTFLFCCYTCNETGVAIENISKMLGHTDTRMTLHYTKISDTRIKQDMEQVREVFD